MQLNKGQEEALRQVGEFLHNQDRVFSILGAPGTGKTHLINTIKETYPQINLTASTNQAASLIRGRTIHNLTGFRIKNVKEGEGSLSNNNVILIDEASMLPAYIMNHIVNNLVNKVILVGDPNQLVVGACVDITKFPNVELTENMRAKSKAIEKLIEHLSWCVVSQTMPDFTKHRGEHLNIITDFNQYIDMIDKDETQHEVLAYRNAIVEKYNELTDQGMTVHKAQGQSYDTVFIDMSDIYSAYSQQKTQWNNPISLDEMLRMILVGMSRARHKIVVFYGKSRARSCVQGTC